MAQISEAEELIRWSISEARNFSLEAQPNKLFSPASDFDWEADPEKLLPNAPLIQWNSSCQIVLKHPSRGNIVSTEQEELKTSWQQVYRWLNGVGSWALTNLWSKQCENRIFLAHFNSYRINLLICKRSFSVTFYVSIDFLFLIKKDI